MKKVYPLIVGVMSVGVMFIMAFTALAQDTAEENSPLGRWTSVACELRPGPQFLTRDFTFEEDSWVGDITIYADAACTTPSILLHIEGPILFGEAVTVAEGAVATDFSGETVTLTPLLEGITDFLNSADADTCGTEVWELNVEQDVSATGCGLFGLEVPFTEYDITLVRDNYLFAGARPVDGSSFPDPMNRPTALQVPLMRVTDGQ